MKTDKAQFDAVLSRMLQSPPKKESQTTYDRHCSSVAKMTGEWENQVD
jgi:hypothetical protein